MEIIPIYADVYSASNERVHALVFPSAEITRQFCCYLHTIINLLAERVHSMQLNSFGFIKAGNRSIHFILVIKIVY